MKRMRKVQIRLGGSEIIILMLPAENMYQASHVASTYEIKCTSFRDLRTDSRSFRELASPSKNIWNVGKQRGFLRDSYTCTLPIVILLTLTVRTYSTRRLFSKSSFPLIESSFDKESLSCFMLRAFSYV